jgi:hypothetical protein
MKEKRDIVESWLPRYTGTPLGEFGEYVLLTNFDNYVEWFATLHGGLVKGVDRPMPNVTADGITLINFGNLCCGICQPHFDWRAASCVRSANDPRGGEDRRVGSGDDCELRRKAYQNRDRGLEACAAPWPQRQAFAFRRRF